ncbi:MAG: DUF421 domain-containing protein [Bacilli bacterium]
MSDLIDVKWMELLDVFIRAMLSLVTLFLITKMLGKKQVSQLSLFDYVIGISIGNFAAEMTINLESHYLNGILAVVVFGVMAYLVSYATLKSIKLRRFFMGTPTIMIQNGKLLEKNMVKVKLDINDLLEECRGKGYFDISEIEYAIMEVNGTLSILPKGKYKPLVIGDMNFPVQKQGLCANIIIDGKLMNNNLKTVQKNEEWLLKELKKQGYYNYEKILLATVDVDNKLVVYERNREVEPKDVLE